jgi:hypothetical protein
MARGNPRYTVCLHQDTFLKASNYQEALLRNPAAVGRYFGELLEGVDMGQCTAAEFIELLVRTKKPQIFAESAVFGDGSDWNQTELSILGDIGVALPVIVYDNGRHTHPDIHERQFPATLLYVPGALLENGRGLPPADWSEVTVENQIDPDAFYALYERRLLPLFLYANRAAASKGKQAFITLPGLGCGQFAGPFRGSLGQKLNLTLQALLRTHARRLPNIRVVYFDPYRECGNERLEIEHLSFLVRPLTHGNSDKPQLCLPQTYADPGEDFSGCDLFSVVAWDHVSWPGNDFYAGARATDDGVKAAATNSMAGMTGVKGTYNAGTAQYEPPGTYRNWREVIQQTGVQLQVKDSLFVAE